MLAGVIDDALPTFLPPVEKRGFSGPLYSTQVCLAKYISYSQPKFQHIVYGEFLCFDFSRQAVKMMGSATLTQKIDFQWDFLELLRKLSSSNLHSISSLSILNKQVD